MPHHTDLVHREIQLKWIEYVRISAADFIELGNKWQAEQMTQ
ncbi:MAG TPA: hypothetical protein PKZ53_05490 [Acidobacteriota bacterium]|nr:hypothetical protein [Acidobacteriota bacterium]HNG95374.1 hypothetical protein [Acidobacteriota bacterium]HNJ39921.1 hypothetical protein [Acidobacteriota bacterium]